MAVLNATFTRPVNGSFNNKSFIAGTIPGMHETAARLYEAAKKIKGVEGQSAVARLLNESPQTLNNWETRGVSKAGAIDAQAAIGCSVLWLMTGEGPMVVYARQEASLAAVAAEPHSPYPVATDDLVIHQYEAGGAMGHGLQLEEQPPGLIKSWRVDHEWLRLNVRHHTGIHNLRIVTGFGPSMRGMFNPGDPLLCDCGVNTVETDAVYFFRIDSHGFIKMLQRIPTESGMILRAKSKNPDYDPFDITEKVMRSEGFEVFGKILTVWKSEQL